MTIRSFLAAMLLVLASGVLGLPAAADTPFSPAALAEAQKSGKPVLVEVFAPWCPTCKAQNAVLDQLKGDTRFKDLIRLRVDFDSQKDALRALGANSQSTLIVYKGETEVGRLVGETSPEAIEALLAKGL
jgi:thiol-disulfide isomerase/thioredoxin